jgi:hypothetical protein
MWTDLFGPEKCLTCVKVLESCETLRFRTGLLPLEYAVANIPSSLFIWSIWGSAADDRSAIPNAIRRAFSDTLEVDRQPFRKLLEQLERRSHGRALAKGNQGAP